MKKGIIVGVEVSRREVKDYNDKSGLTYYWLESNIGRVLLVVLFAWLGVWGVSGTAA